MNWNWSQEAELQLAGLNKTPGCELSMNVPSIQPSRVAISTFGYLLVTFPLAYIWHLVLFKETYENLGYFTRDEPVIAFGFGAILLQGILLSVVFPCIRRGSSLASDVIRFVAIMGSYHWTMHVLAAAAKHDIAPLPTWFALETTYLSIQFLLGGFLIALVQRSRRASTQPQ